MSQLVNILQEQSRINGFVLGSDEHLYGHKLLNNTPSFANYPVSYYEENMNTLDRNRKTYAHQLAFYQRIRLNLEYVIAPNRRFYPDTFPIENTLNFVKFEELFNKYLQQYLPFKTKEQTIKKYRDNSLSIVLRLWLCGYGILEGYGKEPIMASHLRSFFERNDQTKIVKACARYLSQILSNEPESPVQEVLEHKGKVATDVLILEEKQWEPTNK